MRKHSFSFLVIMLATGLFASTAPAQGIFSGIVLDHEDNEFEGATIIMESTSSARSSTGGEARGNQRRRRSVRDDRTGQWSMDDNGRGRGIPAPVEHDDNPPRSELTDEHLSRTHPAPIGDRAR